MVSKGNTQEMQQEANNAYNTLQESGRNLKEDLQGFGRAAVDVAAEKAEEIKMQGEKKFQEAKQYTEKSKVTLEQWIMDEPLKSLAIAAGAGVIIGLYLRGGKH